MAKKYRRIPVLVNAFQYTGDDDELRKHFPHAEFKIYDGKICAKSIMDGIWVPINVNEWLVEGSEGEEYYTFTDDVFHDLYDDETTPKN